jgi:hypothetical protein
MQFFLIFLAAPNYSIFLLLLRARGESSDLIVFRDAWVVFTAIITRAHFAVAFSLAWAGLAAVWLAVSRTWAGLAGPSEIPPPPVS